MSTKYFYKPADILFPDGLLSDGAVEQGVECLEQVVVRVDLHQGDWHCHAAATTHTAAIGIVFKTTARLCRAH